MTLRYLVVLVFSYNGNAKALEANIRDETPGNIRVPRSLISESQPMRAFVTNRQ